MFFDDWNALLRTAVVAPLAYLVLLLVLRVSGKRALSQLNAFDLIVSVALGSVLASVAVSPDVSLAGGATAFALLAGLQYAAASLSTRLPGFQRLIKAAPTLLVRDGSLLEEAMERQRVTHAAILQVLRQEGLSSVDDVAAVVLETDGSFSVVRDAPEPGRRATLENVAGWT
ncbi:MAG: YetF domain-containing protein [Egibacteraceae bacterium]